VILFDLIISKVHLELFVNLKRNENVRSCTTSSKTTPELKRLEGSNEKYRYIYLYIFIYL